MGKLSKSTLGVVVSESIENGMNGIELLGSVNSLYHPDIVCIVHTKFQAMNSFDVNAVAVQ